MDIFTGILLSQERARYMDANIPFCIVITVLAAWLGWRELRPGKPRSAMPQIRGAGGLVHSYQTNKHIWILAGNGEWKEYDPERQSFK